MAELRDGDTSGLTPEKLSAWIGLLLQSADAILRLFGRRKHDHPQRKKPDETLPR